MPADCLPFPKYVATYNFLFYFLSEEHSPIFYKPVHINFFYLNVTSLPQNLLERQVVDDDNDEMMMSVDFNLDSIFLGLFLALGHLDV